MRTFGESRKNYQTARKFVPGGVHSGFRFRIPHPIYFRRALGSKLWDVDGNEYIDCLINNGACILGHRDPSVTRAVRAQLDSGLTVGLESPLGIEVAGQLNRMIPSAESVKFANSGTEAVVHAIQIARGYTRRGSIIKVEGCYDGWTDEVNVSVHPPTRGRAARRTYDPIPETGGTARRVPPLTKVVPYNDADSLRRLVRESGNNFAALIVEPVMFNSGCVIPKDGYLQELREITEENDILLIFDEVITGFRMAPGGAQEYYSVTPDVSVFGKAIANGFPISAVVGLREVMEVTNPSTGSVMYAGTYNASQMSLAAARETLKQLKSGQVQRDIQSKVSQLSKKFNDRAEEMRVDARMVAIGGNFQVYFTNEEILDYASASRSNPKEYADFIASATKKGVLLSQSRLFHHGVSAAHSTRDVRSIADVFGQSLEKISAGTPHKA